MARVDLTRCLRTLGARWFEQITYCHGFHALLRISRRMSPVNVYVSTLAIKPVNLYIRAQPQTQTSRYLCEQVSY